MYLNNSNPRTFLNEFKIEFIQRGEVVLLVSFLEHYLFLYFDPLNIKNLFPSSEGFFFSFCEKKNQKDILLDWYTVGKLGIFGRIFEVVNDTSTYRDAQKIYLGHITWKHFDLLGNIMIMEISLLIWTY